jgi:hypothetical protein
MWSPFKKKPNVKSSVQEDVAKKKVPTPSLPNGMEMPDTKDMNMLQKFAMKRFMAMSPEEQKKMAEKMLTPKNVAKHKKEIMEQLELARKSGMMSDDQYRMAKRKLGI